MNSGVPRFQMYGMGKEGQKSHEAQASSSLSPSQATFRLEVSMCLWWHPHRTPLTTTGQLCTKYFIKSKFSSKYLLIIIAAACSLLSIWSWKMTFSPLLYLKFELHTCKFRADVLFSLNFMILLEANKLFQHNLNHIKKLRKRETKASFKIWHLSKVSTIFLEFLFSSTS